ncbi:hypothetical protein SAMN05421871_1251, partial [Actinokineospora alba]
MGSESDLWPPVRSDQPPPDALSQQLHAWRGGADKDGRFFFDMAAKSLVAANGVVVAGLTHDVRTALETRINQIVDLAVERHDAGQQPPDVRFVLRLTSRRQKLVDSAVQQTMKWLTDLVNAKIRERRPSAETLHFTPSRSNHRPQTGTRQHFDLTLHESAAKSRREYTADRELVEPFWMIQNVYLCLPAVQRLEWVVEGFVRRTRSPYSDVSSVGDRLRIWVISDPENAAYPVKSVRDIVAGVVTRLVGPAEAKAFITEFVDVHTYPKPVNPRSRSGMLVQVGPDPAGRPSDDARRPGLDDAAVSQAVLFDQVAHGEAATELTRAAKRLRMLAGSNRDLASGVFREQKYAAAAFSQWLGEQCALEWEALEPDADVAPDLVVALAGQRTANAEALDRVLREQLIAARAMFLNARLDVVESDPQGSLDPTVPAAVIESVKAALAEGSHNAFKRARLRQVELTRDAVESYRATSALFGSTNPPDPAGGPETDGVSGAPVMFWMKNAGPDQAKDPLVLQANELGIDLDPAGASPDTDVFTEWLGAQVAQSEQAVAWVRGDARLESLARSHRVLAELLDAEVADVRTRLEERLGPLAPQAAAVDGEIAALVPDADVTLSLSQVLADKNVENADAFERVLQEQVDAVLGVFRLERLTLAESDPDRALEVQAREELIERAIAERAQATKEAFKRARSRQFKLTLAAVERHRAHVWLDLLEGRDPDSAAELRAAEARAALAFKGQLSELKAHHLQELSRRLATVVRGMDLGAAMDTQFTANRAALKRVLREQRELRMPAYWPEHMRLPVELTKAAPAAPAAPVAPAAPAGPAGSPVPGDARLLPSDLQARLDATKPRKLDGLSRHTVMRTGKVGRSWRVLSVVDKTVDAVLVGDAALMDAARAVAEQLAERMNAGHQPLDVRIYAQAHFAHSPSDDEYRLLRSDLRDCAEALEQALTALMPLVDGSATFTQLTRVVSGVDTVTHPKTNVGTDIHVGFELFETDPVGLEHYAELPNLTERFVRYKSFLDATAAKRVRAFVMGKARMRQKVQIVVAGFSPTTVQNAVKDLRARVLAGLYPARDERVLINTVVGPDVRFALHLDVIPDDADQAAGSAGPIESEALPGPGSTVVPPPIEPAPAKHDQIHKQVGSGGESSATGAAMGDASELWRDKPASALAPPRGWTVKLRFVHDSEVAKGLKFFVDLPPGSVAVENGELRGLSDKKALHERIAEIVALVVARHDAEQQPPDVRVRFRSRSADSVAVESAMQITVDWLEGLVNAQVQLQRPSAEPLRLTRFRPLHKHIVNQHFELVEHHSEPQGRPEYRAMRELVESYWSKSDEELSVPALRRLKWVVQGFVLRRSPGPYGDSSCAGDRLRLFVVSVPWLGAARVKVLRQVVADEVERLLGDSAKAEAFLTEFVDVHVHPNDPDGARDAVLVYARPFSAVLPETSLPSGGRTKLNTRQDRPVAEGLSYVIDTPPESIGVDELGELVGLPIAKRLALEGRINEIVDLVVARHDAEQQPPDLRFHFRSHSWDSTAVNKASELTKRWVERRVNAKVQSERPSAVPLRITQAPVTSSIRAGVRQHFELVEYHSEPQGPGYYSAIPELVETYWSKYGGQLPVPAVRRLQWAVDGFLLRSPSPYGDSSAPAEDRLRLFVVSAPDRAAARMAFVWRAVRHVAERRLGDPAKVEAFLDEFVEVLYTRAAKREGVLLYAGDPAAKPPAANRKRPRGGNQDAPTGKRRRTDAAGAGTSGHIESSPDGSAVDEQAGPPAPDVDMLDADVSEDGHIELPSGSTATPMELSEAPIDAPGEVLTSEQEAWLLAELRKTTVPSGSADSQVLLTGEYVEDYCDHRAHVWAVKLLSIGVPNVAKVFVAVNDGLYIDTPYAYGATESSPGRVAYGHHVAPLFEVEAADGSGPVQLVLDLTVSPDRVLTVGEWLDALHAPRSAGDTSRLPVQPLPTHFEGALPDGEMRLVAFDPATYSPPWLDDYFPKTFDETSQFIADGPELLNGEREVTARRAFRRWHHALPDSARERFDTWHESASGLDVRRFQDYFRALNEAERGEIADRLAGGDVSDLSPSLRLSVWLAGLGLTGDGNRPDATRILAAVGITPQVLPPNVSFEGIQDLAMFWLQEAEQDQVEDLLEQLAIELGVDP